MKKTIKSYLAMFLLAECVLGEPTSALPSEAKADLDRATLLSYYAEWADKLRDSAIHFEDEAESVSLALFSSGAQSSWNRYVTAELNPLQQADFFLGAQTWMGPFDQSGAVIGFFNPWWNALLVVRSKGGDLQLSEKGEATPPEVERFAWISGETIRHRQSGTEPVQPAQDTVIPAELPLSVALWRAQRDALAYFESRCEKTAPDNPSRFSFKAFPDIESPEMAKEWERIQVRSALRLKQLELLSKNELGQALAVRSRDLLRSASRPRLRAHFSDPVHSFFVDTFSKLPAEGETNLRKGFEIYGYVPAEAGTLVVLVNAEVPRLYATVSFPRGREEKPEAGDVIFEWYDFSDTGEFLKAWEKENGAANAASGNGAPAGHGGRSAAMTLNDEGVALAGRGETSAAEEKFREALEANPGFGEAARNLAKILVADGSFGEAETVLANAAEAAGGVVDLLVPLAQVEALIGNESLFGEVLAELEKKVETSETLSSLSALLLSQGSVAAAKKAASAATARPDAGAEEWLTLGLAEERAGSWGDAKGAYEKCIALDAKSFRGWIGLGNAQDNTGDWQNAVESYEKAIALEPASPLAQYNLGRLLALRTPNIDRGVDLLVTAANGTGGDPADERARKEAKRLLQHILAGAK